MPRLSLCRIVHFCASAHPPSSLLRGSLPSSLHSFKTNPNPAILSHPTPKFGESFKLTNRSHQPPAFPQRKSDGTNPRQAILHPQSSPLHLPPSLPLPLATLASWRSWRAVPPSPLRKQTHFKPIKTPLRLQKPILAPRKSRPITKSNPRRLFMFHVFMFHTSPHLVPLSACHLVIPTALGLNIASASPRYPSRIFFTSSSGTGPFGEYSTTQNSMRPAAKPDRRWLSFVAS